MRAQWGSDGSFVAPDEPLWARVARNVAAWGPGGTAGLVVGATAPNELRAVRAIAPGIAVLVPGVGSQGGATEPVLAYGPATEEPAGGRPGGGLVVNVSRGIAQAALGPGAGRAGAAPDVAAASSANGSSPDPGERLAEAARSWSAKLPVLP